MDLPQSPPEQELKNIIDKLAQFVARNGPEFEQMTKQKQRDNPKFSFLFGGEFFNYYQYKVTTEQAILKQKQRSVDQQAIVQHVVNQQSIQSAPWQQQQQQQQAIPQPTLTPEMHEQIRQSEQNLAAQHTLLMQQQQVQIDEAIRKALEERVLSLCKEANIDIAELDSVLQPIIDSCTKDSISSGKGWIFANANSGKGCEVVAQHILRKITAPGTSFEAKLHLVYLINDVLHHCARKNAEDLKKTLNRVVVPIFCSTSISADADQRQKLLKVYNLWETNKYFSQEILEQLQNPVNSLATFQAGLITEFSGIVTPITIAIQNQYAMLQKQHSDFVAHLTNQVQRFQHMPYTYQSAQNPNVAIHPAVSIPYSGMPQHSPHLLPQQQQQQQGLHGLDPGQLQHPPPQLAHQQQTPSQLDAQPQIPQQSGQAYSQSEQNHVLQDTQKKRDETEHDVSSLHGSEESAHKRDNEDASAPIKENLNLHNTDSHSSSETHSITSSSEKTDLPSSTVPSSPPPRSMQSDYNAGMSHPGSGFGNEFRSDEGRPYGHRPGQPPAHRYDDFSPPPFSHHQRMGFHDPDYRLTPPHIGSYSAPPPHFGPIPPRGMPIGGINHDGIPHRPIPPEFIDIMPPTPPYYDLPAGLMVPLVKLDDTDYNLQLDPKDVRLPPPSLPTERLIAAVELFYSPPSHDRARNSEGWEQLGLYEYFKAKSQAKKQKQGEGSGSGDDSQDSLNENRMIGELSNDGCVDQHPLKTTPEEKPPKRRYREFKSPEKSTPAPVEPEPSGRSESHRKSNSRSRSRSRSRSPPIRRRSPRRSYSRHSPRSRSPSPVSRRRSPERSPTPPSFFGGSYASNPIDHRLDESNKGHQLLKKMGWSGSGLGATEQGIQDPVDAGEVRDRQDMYKGIGISLNDPYENFRKHKGQAFINRMKARAEELGKK